MEEYKLYYVGKEEKLSSVALKNSTTPEKIKAFNPKLRLFGGFLTSEYVSAQQHVKIPILMPKKSLIEIENEQLKNFVFEKEARYRCEQLNITKVNGDTVTLSSEIKAEYLFLKQKDIPENMQILLTDYLFSVEPSYFNEGFDFSQQIENVKRKVSFCQNEKGEITTILNILELRRKWEKFRDNELLTIPLYKNLKDQASEQAKDIIKTGNMEFSSSEKLGFSLCKNLFYHILLKANVGDHLENYSLKQYSQLFPNLELTTNIVKTKVKEENGITTYRLVGILDKKNISEEALQKKYDEIYKPIIKYNFTTFNYIYRITYSIENKSNLLVNAKASLSEKIKNNFEVITTFFIKKVEL